MIFGVLSDTHNHLDATRRAFDALRGAAGEHLPVQQLSVLDDDFLSLAADDEGILQVLRDDDVCQGGIQGADHRPQSLQHQRFVDAGKAE